MSLLGGFLAEALGLDHLLELVEALAGLPDRLRIGRQGEVAGLSAKDEVIAAALSIVPAVLALQLGNLLVEVSRQLIDGNDAIGLITFLVGLALEAGEDGGREQAVLF